MIFLGSGFISDFYPKKRIEEAKPKLKQNTENTLSIINPGCHFKDLHTSTSLEKKTKFFRN